MKILLIFSACLNFYSTTIHLITLVSSYFEDAGLFMQIDNLYQGEMRTFLNRRF